MHLPSDLSAELIREQVAPHVDVLSQPEDINFPDSWYDIVDADHFWAHWRQHVFMAQLKALDVSPKASLKVLDVGCGSATLRNSIEAVTNWTIDAADLNLPALNASKPGRGRTLLYDLASRHPSLLGHYDAVMLFDVLEHIEDPTDFVAALVAHVRPGGLVLINVPALNSLYSEFDRVVGHFRRYNRNELLETLGSLPLEHLDTRYWGFSLVPVALARKLAGMFTLRGKADNEILRAGVQPGAFSKLFLNALMKIETKFMTNPLMGTSLMYAGRRLPEESPCNSFQ